MTAEQIDRLAAILGLSPKDTAALIQALRENRKEKP